MQTQSNLIIGVPCAVQAVSLIVVLLAGWSRLRLVEKKLNLYTLLMLVSWLLALGLTVSIADAARHGFGHHEVNLSPAAYMRIDTDIYAASIFYQLGLMAQKTGLLVLFYSVLAVSNVARRFTVAIIAIVNVGGLALTLLCVFRCNPIPAAWSNEGPGSCINILTIYLASAPLNISTDLAIFLIPLPALWSLCLPRRQKVALLLTFGCGLFVTVIDVVRVIYLEKASGDTIGSLQGGGDIRQGIGSNDFSWYASLSFMWSAVETNLGIICACVPSLKPLLSRNTGTAFARRRRYPLPRNVRAVSLEQLTGSMTASLPMSPPSPVLSLQRTTSKPEVLATREVATDCWSPTSPSSPPTDIMLPESCVLPRRAGFLRSGSGVLGFSANTRQDRFESILSDDYLPSRPTVLARLAPFIAMTGLFLVWGFEYGLLTVVNQAFQHVGNFSSAQTTALHSLYYVGYVAGPPCLGYHLLHRRYFKQSCLAGLAIFACGALVFWPASVLQSYAIYAICNFVLGFGLSNLEIAADTYMVLAGPSRNAASRLAFSQGVQAAGTVVAGAIFDQSTTLPTPLLALQWLYLGLALLAIAIAVGYSLIPLPIPDIDGVTSDSDTSFRSQSTRYRPSRSTALLVLGVLAIVCYVGAQEVNATMMRPFFIILRSESLILTTDISVSHAAFSVSRFAAAGLAIWLPPRLLLTCFWLATLLFQILCMVGNFTDSTMTVLVILTLFFEGPLFPLTFAETMRFSGRHKVLAATLLTSAIGVGGSVLSPIAGAIQDSGPSDQARHDFQTSLAVGVGALALGLIFPVSVNWPRTAKRSDQRTVSAGEDVRPVPKS